MDRGNMMLVERRNELRATRGRSWGEVQEVNKKKKMEKEKRQEELRSRANKKDRRR